MLRNYTVYVKDNYRDKEFQFNVKAHSMLRAILVAEVVVSSKDMRDKPSSVYNAAAVATSSYDDTLLRTESGPLQGDLEFTVCCDNNILITANQLTDYYYSHHEN